MEQKKLHKACLTFHDENPEVMQQSLNNFKALLEKEVKNVFCRSGNNWLLNSYS